MPKKSSYFVKNSLSKLSRLMPKYSEHVVDFLNALEEFKVQAVILFGSYAKGNFTESSDIDMIIVCETLPDSPMERYLLIVSLADFPIQPFIFTPTELSEEIQRPNFILLDALEDGIILLDNGVWKNSLQLYFHVTSKYELLRTSSGWSFNPKQIPY